ARAQVAPAPRDSDAPLGAPPVTSSSARRDSLTAAAPPRPVTAAPPPASYVVSLASPPRSPVPDTNPRAVPDVRGLPLRAAAGALHRAGFRVALAAGAGSEAAGTLPAAGAIARRGATVRLLHDR
ncbi:MAG: PASTA domain-containing protein, partial [Gemmatimonadaceae bacterium]